MYWFQMNRTSRLSDGEPFGGLAAGPEQGSLESEFYNSEDASLYPNSFAVVLLHRADVRSESSYSKHFGLSGVCI
ncbi:hypothetical protein SCLCIDRAFT_1218086 [Scleroderma citrinum Foug A]|uniref:Uncharacterized protein n=1 Tax=Scleroderma citrinum Foug A TaxID=1036808 RepID=A0A0C3DT40_9AGAM|nr:hypothetical protein SCLCIDRAFT_1218086 [Scleroderma citrinum Foug A]